jgi:hypothetical protein
VSYRDAGSPPRSRCLVAMTSRAAASAAAPSRSLAKPSPSKNHTRLHVAASVKRYKLHLKKQRLETRRSLDRFSRVETGRFQAMGKLN